MNDSPTHESTDQPTHAVTGAFGYSGKYIAQRLLDDGRHVITLTGSPNRPNLFGDRVRAVPFNFDKPEQLTKSLEGVQVLYNTYWVRFNHRSFTHADAVQNTKTLFRAAADAGIQRIVMSASPTPPKTRPSNTSAARQNSKRPCNRQASPTRSSVPRFSSERKTSSSTTSPGPSGDSPSSASSATAPTSCNPSTSTISRNWQSSKASRARTSSSTPSVPRPLPIANSSQPSPGYSDFAADGSSPCRHASDTLPEPSWAN